MPIFNLDSILEALEKLGLDPDGKSGQVQKVFGYLAEEKLEAIYFSEHRLGVTAWFDEDATSEDWRDTPWSGAGASFVEFVEARTAGAPRLIRPTNQKVPDIATLAGVVREFYELKPSLQPLQANRRVRRWGVSDSAAKHFREKAESIEFLAHLNGIPEIEKGTLWNVATVPRLIIGVSVDDFRNDEIPTLLGLDNSPTTLDKLERLGQGVLDYGIPAAMSLMGYRFEFRRMKPGLVVWRLRRLASHPVDFTVPVTRQIPDVIEDVRQELRRIYGEINKTVADPQTIAILAMVAVIVLLAASLVSGGLAAATALVVIAIGLWLLQSETTDNAMAATAPVTILGNNMEMEPTHATSSVLARSVGVGASNGAKDTAYVQMLLNGVRSRDGLEGVAITGLCLTSTVSAIRDFTRVECDQEVDVLRPGSREVGILQTRFLEYTIFGESVSNFSIFKSATFSKDLLPAAFRDFPNRIAKAFRQYLSDVRAAMPAVAPAHLDLESDFPNGLTDDDKRLLLIRLRAIVQDTSSLPADAQGIHNKLVEHTVKRFGELANATRLLIEVREIVGDTSAMPTDPREIYVNLAEHTETKLGDASEIYKQIRTKAGQIVRRAAWGAHDWPDMTKKIYFDWGYDTIVIHHSGNGLLRAKDTAEKVESYHRGKEGWADIGYHFVIHKDGTLHEARSLIFRGAHVHSEKHGVTNHRKIGVLLCGDFQHQWWDPFVDDISESQIATAKNLVSALRAGFNVNDMPVIGHRDLNPDTVCPGDELVKVLGQIG